MWAKRMSINGQLYSGRVVRYRFRCSQLYSERVVMQLKDKLLFNLVKLVSGRDLIAFKSGGVVIR